MKKLFYYLIFFQVILIPLLLHSKVPQPNVHNPPVPFYMDAINFQSIATSVFGSFTKGMLGNTYSELAWNPAAVLSTKQNSFYLELDYNGQAQSQNYYINPAYQEAYLSDIAIVPAWVYNSPINSLNMTPIYQFAMVKELSKRISIGIINRSIFDYGPFRTSNVYTGFWNEDAISNSYSDIELKALEVDDNQQKVLANQAELYFGYQISSKLDLGFRLGNYIFRRDGDLYDSEWSQNPHYDYADLNDESLEIEGDHIELAAGLFYEINKSTRLGLQGSYMTGSSDDERHMLDTTYSWSEDAEDTRYFSINKFNLQRDENYKSEDDRYQFSLNLEKKFARKWTWRTGIRGTWKKADIDGEIISFDTSFTDRTYDDYDNGSYHFRRRTLWESTDSDLIGSGDESTDQYEFYSALVYKPEKWSFFTGLYIFRNTFETNIQESSSYYYNQFTQYTEYKPGSIEYERQFEKNYEYKLEEMNWKIGIPLGFKIEVGENFQIMAGSSLLFEINDSKSSGDLIYPDKIYKKWDDGQIVIDDHEVDRYEKYTSDPSLELNRSTNVNLGAIYHHPLGINVYVKSRTDFFETTGWVLGLELEL
ncbi:MAG TPA: hypothetical protein VKP78_09285 [bacterium]|nr:hypothetical protein [bacterium]